MSRALQEAAADIAAAAAAPETVPPEDMVLRLRALGEQHTDLLKEFRMLALVCAGHPVKTMVEAGAPREDALRLLANELLANAAFLVRNLKRLEGQPFSAARFALVAHALAEDVAALPGWEAAQTEADDLQAQDQG